MDDLDTQKEKLIRFFSDYEDEKGDRGPFQLKETHLSLVFLGQHFVYKIKKPSFYPFIDFSTLEKRKLNCDAEYLINQELGGDTYLEVVPLMLDNQKKLCVGGKGKVVEWMVKMKRLPDDKNLEFGIVEQKIDQQHMKEVAQKLMLFYQSRPREQISVTDYHYRLYVDTCHYLHELKNSILGIPKERIEIIFEWMSQCLSAYKEMFFSRAFKVIDAHGDLKPEHIYLTDPPVIIDRLEFSTELRLLDPVEELSYFAMECDYLKAGWVGDFFLEFYSKESGDQFDDRLVTFYKIFRAILRSFLSFRHVLEPAYKKDPKWRKKGLEYLILAESYMRSLKIESP